MSTWDTILAASRQLALDGGLHPEQASRPYCWQFEFWACPICDRTGIHVGQLDDHIKSKYHQKALVYLDTQKKLEEDLAQGNLPYGTEVRDKWLYCTIRSRWATEQHLSSYQHVRLSERKKNLALSSPPATMLQLKSSVIQSQQPQELCNALKNLELPVPQATRLQLESSAVHTKQPLSTRLRPGQSATSQQLEVIPRRFRRMTEDEKIKRESEFIFLDEGKHA